MALTAGTVADIYGFTDLGNTRSDLIVWSIGGIIFGLVCYTMEDKDNDKELAIIKLAPFNLYVKNYPKGFNHMSIIPIINTLKYCLNKF